MRRRGPLEGPVGYIVRIFRQSNGVSRSLAGIYRKARKIARSKITTSWENRVGRNQFLHKSSRNIENKPF